MNDALIESLRRAVDANPSDVPLRLHLGRLLLDAGRNDEAVAVAGALLGFAAADPDAQRLMADALGATRAPGDVVADVPDEGPPVQAAPDEALGGFDWSAAENQVGDLAAPAFVQASPDDGAPVYGAERPTLTLADVGGMQQVKDRLSAAFLAPLSNPELRRLYGKSLRGGLLMYGPPGCGKTFIARAVAGELGAQFLSIGLTDVLDPMLGGSERNVHEVFEEARRQAPCVVFIDEIDAIGQRRSYTHNSAIRGTVNQLLTELDGIGEANEGVFVLAATNQPWDVDPALRRPGRFDRTVLVLPPDAPAREAIFRHHLRGRPVEGIDLAVLAARTEHFSGADIAYVCELASEHALIDSVRRGEPRLIGMPDLLSALAEVKPSTSGWLDSARNVVTFGNDDGTYTELRAYLKAAKRL